MAAPDPVDKMRARLNALGEPSDRPIDYAVALDLSANDVPALIAVASEWVNALSQKDEESFTYGPVHAWRCLRDLKAVEAIGPLLDFLDPLEEAGDDWFFDDLPSIFAKIGPSALDPLAEYLADPSHRLFSRTAVAGAFEALAEEHPHTRDAAVEALARTLEFYESNDPTLNGFLIGTLTDLKAKEKAELIERAFAANRVDITTCGNWNMVRKEMGVKGLGLVPPELANKPLYPDLPFPLLPSPARPGSQERRRAKRKRERQARKKGRRR